MTKKVLAIGNLEIILTEKIVLPPSFLATNVCDEIKNSSLVFREKPILALVIIFTLGEFLLTFQFLLQFLTRILFLDKYRM